MSPEEWLSQTFEKDLKRIREQSPFSSIRRRWHPDLHNYMRPLYEVIEEGESLSPSAWIWSQDICGYEDFFARYQAEMPEDFTRGPEYPSATR